MNIAIFSGMPQAQDPRRMKAANRPELSAYYIDSWGTKNRQLALCCRLYRGYISPVPELLGTVPDRSEGCQTVTFCSVGIPHTGT